MLTSRLAQLVERKTLNLVVVGSSPTVGAFFVLSCRLFQEPGRLVSLHARGIGAIGSVRP